MMTHVGARCPWGLVARGRARSWAFSSTTLWCLALSVAASPAFAGSPESAGVAFLLTQQKPLDGSFGAATGEDPVVATSEAVLALQAEGGPTMAIEAAQAYLAFASVTPIV